MTDDEVRAYARNLVMGDSEMTLNELQSYLAKAADLLRGGIDQADFKAFIFPLMFFKRMSDVFLEEYAAALVDSGGDKAFASFAENHRFQIPEGCLWEDLRAKTENIGEAIIHAFRQIEKVNADTLFGIFGNAPWSNKQKLPDDTLVDLIEHFSTKTLTNASVSPDVFGDAYEYLIKRFADQSNKKAGEYYTPRSVIQLLVNILDPQEGETVYDPACGTGGMLIQVIEHVKASGGNPRKLWGKLFGQEKVLATSGIARMNLLLHGVEDFRIIKEDTLRTPGFFEGDSLARFDCVLANPPFSLENWGNEFWASDRWGRNQFGVPPASNGDWAWIEHMIASMAAESGRIAVVLPQGALYRKGTEASIRKEILEHDLIEGVIGFGPKLFYGTGLAACALILRSKKDATTKGKVLFINAETFYTKGRNQNSLEIDDIEKIFATYRRFEPIKSLAHVATIEEIQTKGFDLNITLYVPSINLNPASTPIEALAALKISQSKSFTSRLKLQSELEKLDFN
jgi:type I restriction system adenine methylase HsdM